MRRMNRRTFISTSIAATLAASRPSWAADSAHKIERIGVQLYTVRDAMKTDFAGTIAKVAAIGYKEVEFAGYFDHSPKDVRAILDKNDLASPSCHVGYDVVEKKWPETLEAAKIVGHSYIICPWIDEKQRVEPGGWKRAVDLFNRAGEASKKAGIQFGYHNHSFEFDPALSLGGKLPYDFSSPSSIPSSFAWSWISAGSASPERIPSLISKISRPLPARSRQGLDQDASTPSAYQGAMGQSVKFGGRMADVGQGSIDWKLIFAQSGKAASNIISSKTTIPSPPSTT